MQTTNPHDTLPRQSFRSSFLQCVLRRFPALFAVMAIGAVLAPAPAHSQGFGIDIKRQGTGVQLTWNGGILQSAASLAGPWSPVTGAVSHHTITALQSKGYFRVQRAYTLTLAKAGIGTGTVRSTALGMVCGAECSRLIPAGTVVTLEAIPDAGSALTGWSGDGSGRPPVK